MATMWKRAMLYLGLGPDEEYEDNEVAERHAPARRDGSPDPSGTSSGAVRPLGWDRQAAEPSRSEPSRGDPAGSGPAGPASAGSAPAARPAVVARPSGVVRPLTAQPGSSKPYAVAPESFNDAQEVADRFMSSTPVILNLDGVDRELSRRLVDFASGLCYGTRGQMEKVTTSVYLLTPTNVEVSAEDRRKLQQNGG